MLRFRRSVLPLFLMGVIAVGCGDDDGNGMTGPTIADLAGSYVMTQGTLDPAAPQIPNVDLLLVTSSAPTLVIESDGDFTLTLALLGQPAPLQVTGSIAITGSNTGTVTTDMDPNDPADATFSLSGNTLSINVPDAQLIDLTGDGMITEADAGDLDVTFQKQ